MTMQIRALLVAGWLASGLVGAQTPYFDDSSALLRFGSAGQYEVGLRKTNGSIQYMRDLGTGQDVCLGSRFECLWGASYVNNAYVGGCSFSSGGSNHFSYGFDANLKRLTLSFVPGGVSPASAQATVIFQLATDAYFDASIRVTNRIDTRVDYVLFVSDLVFARNDISEAIFPLLPGIRLNSGFFTSQRTYSNRYPTLFSDSVFLSTTRGPLAIYSPDVASGGNFCTTFGFYPDDAYSNGSTILFHNFAVALPRDQEAVLPPMRVRFQAGATQAINKLRTESGIANGPTLADKLGSRLTQLKQSVLYKADFDQLGRTWTQADALFAGLPTPALLHAVAYWSGGFDQRYPDVLPPNPARGSDAQFRAMLANAHAREQLVVPYFNPTWWDNEGPTLTSLPPPLTLNDVAARDINGTPYFESYGPNGGYVMSFASPFVLSKAASVVGGLMDDYQFDYLFQDQIGARNFLYDFNASASGPLSYISNLLSYCTTHQARGLMTERGFDRLAPTHLGFHGGVLLDQRLGGLDGQLGAGNWEPYPLAQMLIGDQVLFYQHNLDRVTMTADPNTLSWNVAMGYMLSFDLASGTTNPWLRAAALMQRELMAEFVGTRVTDFSRINANLTSTSFGAWQIIRNTSAGAQVYGSQTLDAGGFFAASPGGEIQAGYLTTYRGHSLGGARLLLERRKPSYIELSLPLGGAAVQTPVYPNWISGQTVQAAAYDWDDQYLADVPVSWAATDVVVSYPSTIGGVTVYRVRIFGDDCNRNHFPDALDVSAGRSPDVNHNSIPDECDCIGDLNGDRIVNLSDLALLLANYGATAAPPEQGDLTGDSAVDLSDLALMLSAYGLTCTSP